MEKRGTLKKVCEAAIFDGKAIVAAIFYLAYEGVCALSRARCHISKAIKLLIM